LNQALSFAGRTRSWALSVCLLKKVLCFSTQKRISVCKRVFVIDEQERDKHCIRKWYIWVGRQTLNRMCYSLFLFSFFCSSETSFFVGWLIKNHRFSCLQPLYLSELVSYRAEIFCGSGTYTKKVNKKRDFKIMLQETDFQKKYVKNMIVQQKYDSLIY
jgi:hypothetical protein